MVAVNLAHKPNPIVILDDDHSEDMLQIPDRVLASLHPEQMNFPMIILQGMKYGPDGESYDFTRFEYLLRHPDFFKQSARKHLAMAEVFSDNTGLYIQCGSFILYYGMENGEVVHKVFTTDPRYKIGDLEQFIETVSLGFGELFVETAFLHYD